MEAQVETTTKKTTKKVAKKVTKKKVATSHSEITDQDILDMEEKAKQAEMERDEQMAMAAKLQEEAFKMQQEAQYKEVVKGMAFALYNSYLKRGTYTDYVDCLKQVENMKEQSDKYFAEKESK